MTKADTLAGDLWARLCTVIRDLGLDLSDLPASESRDSLAQYNPRTGTILCPKTLSGGDRVMAVLHELVHAYLHRPDPAKPRAGELDTVEERTAHAVAERVCDSLGLAGYVKAAESWGVPWYELVPVDPNQRTTVDTISAFLKACMIGSSPVTWPSEP